MSKAKKNRPYEKQKRKRASRANPHPTMKHTLGVSYKEEADLDLKMGLEALKKYQESGGLSFHLRAAGTLFKMAADRIDYSEHLLGNTLEEYVKEEKKR